MSDQKKGSIKNLLDRVGDTARNLEVAYPTADGRNLTLKANPSVPGDVDALLQVGRDFVHSELGKSFNLVISQPAAPAQPIQPVPAAQHAAPSSGGMTIEESIKRYAMRQGQKLAASTFYEYGNYHRKLPSHGHRLLAKREAKKTREKTSWKPFTDEDLNAIFNAATFLAQKNPTDYWLPLLGLFTGGRISELCQIVATTDIKQVDGVWAISITHDDEIQRLKSPAAKRTISLHPQRPWPSGLRRRHDALWGVLFPYLTRDTKKENLSATPSERWGKYLDSIGITGSRKVFHSFPSPSNHRFKQNGVAEETRCQCIGHEHDTVNSRNYSEHHRVAPEGAYSTQAGLSATLRDQFISERRLLERDRTEDGAEAAFAAPQGGGETNRSSRS